MFFPYTHLVLARVLLPFIVGILLAVYLPGIAVIALVTLILGLTCGIVYHLISNVKPSRNWQVTYGIIIYLVVMATGYLLTYVHQTINDRVHFSRYYIENSQWIAQIKSPPQLLGDTYKLKVDVVTVCQSNKRIGTTGSLLVYMPVDSNSSQLLYGDRLLMKSTIKEVPLPQNPYEFNRRSYLAWQQYYHQSTAYPGQWRNLHVNKGRPFLKWLYQFRASLVQRLASHINGPTLAITSSLLLGYRDLLDEELLKSYSAAGVVHVLSVSGLHVGLIAVFIWWLTSFIGLQWLRYCLSIIVIWVFAIFTGLSPPVMRAAVIFSFVMAGKIIRRDMDSVNSLAAAAMLLLAINPFLLMDIGFELSFASVAGVVLMTPVLSKPFRTWPTITRTIANGVVASISATVSTLPLTLYYFHQAPTYFILSNLIIIPMAAFIMAFGALLLVISPLTWLSTYTAKLLHLLVLTTNHTIGLINNLPLSHWSNIALSPPEILLLATAIVLLILFIQNNKPILLMLSLASCTLLTLIGIPKQKDLYQQQKLVVYALNKHTALDLINGRQDVLLCDDSLLLDDHTWQQHIAPSRMFWGLTDPITECLNEDTSSFNALGLWRDGNYAQYLDKRIMVLNNWHDRISPTQKLKVDYLLLTKGGHIDLKLALSAIEPGLIIIDNSSSENKTQKWADLAADLGVKVYNIRKEGAYLINPVSNSIITE